MPTCHDSFPCLMVSIVALKTKLMLSEGGNKIHVKHTCVSCVVMPVRRTQRLLRTQRTQRTQPQHFLRGVEGMKPPTPATSSTNPYLQAFTTFIIFMSTSIHLFFWTCNITSQLSHLLQSSSSFALTAYKYCHWSCTMGLINVRYLLPLYLFSFCS